MLKQMDIYTNCGLPADSKNALYMLIFKESWEAGMLHN